MSREGVPQTRVSTLDGGLKVERVVPAPYAFLALFFADDFLALFFADDFLALFFAEDFLAERFFACHPFVIRCSRSSL